jgi:hypothetical protein
MGAFLAARALERERKEAKRDTVVIRTEAAAQVKKNPEAGDPRPAALTPFACLRVIHAIHGYAGPASSATAQMAVPGSD